MPVILVNLLILVLVLYLLQLLLNVIGLEPQVKNIVWIIAIILGILWLFGMR